MSSSHSVGKTPQRKLGSKGPNGDRGPQPRAEFRGKRKTVMSYEGYHGSYNEMGFAHPNATRANERPYEKRVPVTPDKSRSGFVTLADAHVVRQRNLPVILQKQLHEKGRFAHPKLREIDDILFPQGSKYTTQEPKYRPNIGVIQTRFWTDHQVKTWGLFAMSYGIKYSGKTEFQIPRDIQGYVSYGSYYSKNVPWPQPGKQAFLEKVRRLSRHRRSEAARIRRSLRVRKKDLDVSPEDIVDIIVQRRTLSVKQIGLNIPEGVPFREFKDSLPKVLSLKYGPALQLSEVVMVALRNIYSNPKKFTQDLPWVVNSEENLHYRIRVESPKNSHEWRKQMARLAPFFSADGNIYALPLMADHRHIFGEGYSSTRAQEHLRFPTVQQAGLMANVYQSYIDELQEEGRPVPAVLGSWADDW